MPIRYRCPQCRQLMSIASRMAGKASQCPKCAAIHTVPAESLDDVARPIERVPSAHEPEEPAQDPTGTDSYRTMDLPVVTAPPPMPNDRLAERTQHWIDQEEDEGLVIHGFERKSDELDLIPMVDCVFLLLVFYMITASYALQKTIDVAPPNSEKKGTVQAVQNPEELAQSSIIVQIDDRNRISVDDTLLADPAALSDVLRAKMNGEQKNELVIEADPRAFHETVVAVVDAAHDLQFQKVRMATTAGDSD
jgi:biopolymer transport protein ExbD